MRKENPSVHDVLNTNSHGITDIVLSADIEYAVIVSLLSFQSRNKIGTGALNSHRLCVPHRQL